MLRSLAVLACSLALTAPAAGARYAEDDGPRRPHNPRKRADQAQAELTGALFQASGELREDPRALALALSEVRPVPVPEMFRLYDTEVVPAEWLSESDEPVRLGPIQVRALQRALAAAPRDVLYGHFRIIANGPSSARTRIKAIDLFAIVSAGRELRLLTNLAAPRDPESLVEVRVRHAFRAALGTTLERHPRSALSVRSLFDEAHPGLLYPMVEALDEAEPADGLYVLASILGRVPELDVLVLSAIGRLADRANPPVDASVADSVRAFLSMGDQRLVQQAVLTLGKLEDYESVEDMLEMLHSDDSNLRASALRALREITLLPLPADPRPWEDWYAEELAWWTHESHQVFSVLPHGEAPAVIEAISAASRRRLYRHELAESVAQCLTREEVGLVELACSGLAELRSRAALPDLVRCLDRPEERIRQAAWRSLKTITGNDFPPEPGLWRQAL